MILTWCRRALFTPPYRGVPVAVWLYALICCLTVSVSGPLNGYLIGYDDHVRMVQVLNWLNGAGWYDRLITRVNEPDGFTTIWSRLVDMPIAAVVWLAQLVTDQAHAALVASIIVPFAELGILFGAACYFARPLVGKKNAWLIILFVSFTTVLNYKDFSIAGFHAGEASHHPYYIILCLFLYGAIGRAVLGKNTSVVIGMVAALLLAVGIEALPLIAIAVLCAGFVAWYFELPQFIYRVSRGIGIGAVGSLLLLPLHQPPAHWLDISFVEPSVLGAIFVGCAALFLFVEYQVLCRVREKPHQLALLCLTGFVIGGVMLFCFPQIINGPAVGLSPQERMMVFREHAEAQPLWRVAHGVFDFVCLSMPLVIAVAGGIWACRMPGARRRRALNFAYLGFSLATAGCAEYISRFYHHAALDACAWQLWVAQKIGTKIKRQHIFLMPVVFFFLSPLWLLVFPAMGSPFMTWKRVLAFPALRQSMPETCNPLALAEYLNSNYGNDTRVMAQGNDSTRLLYYTHLKIDFLNLYPSGDKFIENERFYGTQDLHDAADIARRHNIDLVVLCPMPVTAPPLLPGEQPMMFERLQNHGYVPWLRPIHPHLRGTYLLYEINKPALEEFLKQ